VKGLRLRLSIGVLFALVGIFLGLFATARPLDDSTIRRFNDATDRQHAPFPTIQIQRVASGFASPVTVTNADDGSGRLFIVEQFGRIRIFVNGTVLPTPFLDIHEVVSCCGEQGLLGLAFHPDYANNGFFYVYYTDVAGNTAIARYTVSAGDPNVADPDSHYPILSQLHQPYTNHNGGQIAFGPDGYLYAGLGDGGAGGDPQIKNILPQPDATAEAPSPAQRPETIERGINYTHAPDVWGLGFRGQGTTVAGADTGIRWTHNALKPHYRGWNGVAGDHNYNWHDAIHDSIGNPCGNDSTFPCDDNGHGTHTIGTATGDDGMGNQIGMARGAKWIGCRNMDQGNGTPARYIECMEWFLAPYPIGGGQGDPLRAPDITINAWHCPPSEGCSVETLQAAVEAQSAAGIMTVVRADSSGPNCSTMEDPPSIYAASYTVGALNTGTDNVASFSSRGPVVIDGSNRIKPDITAPGHEHSLKL
jgi:subtilisin family serine protease